jgi:hypothetical protein
MTEDPIVRGPSASIASTVRLEFVYECGHDRTDDECWETVCTLTHGRLGHVFNSCRCPGGSRRVLTVPTEEMVEAAARAFWHRTAARPIEEWWNERLDGYRDVWREDARAALTAAFNTLGAESS